MKLHKGDTVKIMRGKDRMKTGKIIVVDVAGDRVTIENLNMFKKRSRPKAQGQKGEIVLVPRPVRASNLMLICSNCKNPTRVGFRMDGPRKVRYCKKCKANT